MFCKMALVLQVLRLACIVFSISTIYGRVDDGAPKSVRCSRFSNGGYNGKFFIDGKMSFKYPTLLSTSKTDITSYDAEGNILLEIKDAPSKFVPGDCRIKYMKFKSSIFCNSFKVKLTAVGKAQPEGLIAHTDGNSTYISVRQGYPIYGFDLVHYQNNSLVKKAAVIDMEGCNLHGNEFAYETRGCAPALQSNRTVISRSMTKLTSAARRITIRFGLRNHTYYANNWSSSSRIDYYLNKSGNVSLMKNGSITSSDCSFSETLFARLKCNMNGTTAWHEFETDYPSNEESIEFENDVSSIVSNSTGSELTLSSLHYNGSYYKYYLMDNKKFLHEMKHGSITISDCPTNYIDIRVRVHCFDFGWNIHRIALVQDILPQYFLPMNQSNVHINSNGSHINITLSKIVDDDICYRVYKIQLSSIHSNRNRTNFEQAMGETKTYQFKGAGRVKISLKDETDKGVKAPELEILFNNSLGSRPTCSIILATGLFIQYLLAKF